MKIYVLVKQVPDTETRIKIDGAAISEAGVKWIVSPFDEHALEETLRLREKTQGNITAVSYGPERAKDALRTALALGVDRAVLIKDESYNPLDVGYAATALAAFLKSEGADLVLAGHTAIDSQSSLVPSMIAESLGCPCVNNVTEVTPEGSSIVCKKEIDGGAGVMKCEAPAVLTAAKSLNEPRYPSLKGIMAAKKKTIEEKSAEETLGSSAPPRLEIVSLEMPPDRPQGKILEGDSPEAKAQELVKLLREEARVI